MDQRPPGEGDPQPSQPEPAEPPPAEPPPAAPAPMPWEQPQTPSPQQPRSTIISAEPVLTEQAGTPGPEVAWAAPPPPTQGREVPGAPGFAFASTPRRFVAWMIDNLLIGIVAIVIASVIAAVANVDLRGTGTYYAIFSVITVALTFVYFVLFWTGSRRATPGMRVLQLQVGTAFDGRPLEIGQAVIRWALLGYPLSLVALLPANTVTNLISLAGFFWYIALLVSTIISDTKQGIHDRVVRSAVVQPAGLGNSGLVTACLLLAIIFVVLPFVALIGLIFLGGQISGILDEVGRSI